MSDSKPSISLLPKSKHLFPGTQVHSSDLAEMGFQKCELQILEQVKLPTGPNGINWNTIGEIPDSAGIYAFTVEDGLELRVTYVGKTSHLWMVTKGRLPRGGGARGGQRYGRPRHAGETRKRINVETTAQIRIGRTVKHWVMTVVREENLPVIESELIHLWKLRKTGWNRG